MVIYRIVKAASLESHIALLANFEFAALLKQVDTDSFQMVEVVGASEAQLGCYEPDGGGS